MPSPMTIFLLRITLDDNEKRFFFIISNSTNPEQRLIGHRCSVPDDRPLRHSLANNFITARRQRLHHSEKTKSVQQQIMENWEPATISPMIPTSHTLVPTLPPNTNSPTEHTVTAIYIPSI